MVVVVVVKPVIVVGMDVAVPVAYRVGKLGDVEPVVTVAMVMTHRIVRGRFTVRRDSRQLGVIVEVRGLVVAVGRLPVVAVQCPIDSFGVRAGQTHGKSRACHRVYLGQSADDYAACGC